MASQGVEPRIWLIAGPTASGKSALALRLAQLAGGEVVNADSMQLYRDLRVLTARPSPEDEAAAPHHLFGVADAAEAWSVGRWLKAARPVLADIAARRRTAIVAGGTGLYFAALTRGLSEAPAIAPAVRQEAQAQFDALGEAEFRRRLAVFDPDQARISPGDRQRLVRLYELMLAGGAPSAERIQRSAPALASGSWSGAVIEPPRADLYARCDARLSAMIEDGALAEVKALLARELSPELPAMKAVGVRELADVIEGREDLPSALARAQQATRRYAKRQFTWFRHQTPDWPRVTSLAPDDQWRELRRLIESCE
jgi:tRNA dimethylallyltransferase